MHINRIIKGTSNIIAGNKTIINMQSNINKVHIENNTANDISKKLLKQIIQCNNKHTFIDLDKYKKAHQKLFNSVLHELISRDKLLKQSNNMFIDIDNDKLFNDLVNNMHMQTNNTYIERDKCTLPCDMLFKELKSNDIMHTQKSAGHKDHSANFINDTHARDINNDELLRNRILYHVNKIDNMQKCISKYQKDIASTLSTIYRNDIDTKFCKFKEVNDKFNILFDGFGNYIFNKKIVKEQIILDAKASINIKNYTPIFHSKYICISEIDEYLTDNIATMHNNIKNKKYNEVLALSKLIWSFIFKSIKRMPKHNKIKKANNANKEISNANDANKKIACNDSTNKQKTNGNATNKKVTNLINTSKKIVNV